MGRNTTMMTATPNTMGRNTSIAAWRTTAHRVSSPRRDELSNRAVFSTSTIAPSPNMPIAMASPESVIRFDDIPTTRMTKNVASAAIGS
jgi:hypothetical protein